MPGGEFIWNATGFIGKRLNAPPDCFFLTAVSQVETVYVGDVRPVRHGRALWDRCYARYVTDSTADVIFSCQVVIVAARSTKFTSKWFVFYKINVAIDDFFLSIGKVPFSSLLTSDRSTFGDIFLLLLPSRLSIYVRVCSFDFWLFIAF